MAIPLASCHGFWFPEKILAIPMSIPMIGGPGWGFPKQLPAIPMTLPMANDPGKMFPEKMQLLLCVFSWLVALVEGFLKKY